MSENLSFALWEKKMEFPKCKVICIINCISDEAQKMRLCRLKRSLNISFEDFTTYLGEARQSGIIKSDPYLVEHLKKNTPKDWEFLNGSKVEIQVLNFIFGQQ
jgi:hypothetical protein